MKWIIALLTMVACLVLLPVRFGKKETVSAVVPVDREQDMYGSLRSGHAEPRKPIREVHRRIAAVSQQVVIEGHRAAPQKRPKVFSAARFVCALPIEQTETYTVVLKCAKEAEEAIIRMKKEGCDEITLKSSPSGELYDAIVKTARQHDVRVNA